MHLCDSESLRRFQKLLFPECCKFFTHRMEPYIGSAVGHADKVDFMRLRQFCDKSGRAERLIIGVRSDYQNRLLSTHVVYNTHMDLFTQFSADLEAVWNDAYSHSP